MSEMIPSNGVPVPQGTDPITALLLRAATDPAFDPEKFSVAVAFLERREAAQAHRAFNEAMSRASAEMQSVPKDKSNDYLRARYANLAGMLSVIKPITAQHGLSFRFGTLPHVDPDWMTVTCILSLGSHVETTALSGPILSGEGIKGGKTQMNPLQAVGGTTTYLSRYLLGMVFTLIQFMPDIAQDDDGGDPARGPRQPQPASRPPYQAPADRPQDAPAMAAKPNGAGNGAAAIDPVKRFLDRVGERAKAAATSAELDALDAFVKSRKDLPLQGVAACAVLIKDNRVRLADAAAEEATEEADMLAPETQTLLDEVAAIGTQEALTDWITESAKRITQLSMLDNLLVDDAVKARAVELGGKAE